MTTADLPAVLHIERQCFTCAWEMEMFVAEMEGPVSHALIMEIGQHMIGYATYRVILDEAHLMNIAVAPQFRGRGHGRAFMDHLLEDCSRRGARYLFLEVRESNGPARALYDSMDFTLLGRRRSYYSDNREDALVLMRWLHPPAPEE